MRSPNDLRGTGPRPHEVDSRFRRHRGALSSKLVSIAPARFGFLSGKSDETRDVDAHSCLVADPGAQVSHPRFLKPIDR